MLPFQVQIWAKIQKRNWGLLNIDGLQLIRSPVLYYIPGGVKQPSRSVSVSVECIIEGSCFKLSKTEGYFNIIIQDMLELVAHLIMLKSIFYILRYRTSKLGLKNFVFSWASMSFRMVLVWHKENSSFNQIRAGRLGL